LALVSKQIASELKKKQLLSGIVNLMKVEIESQEKSQETLADTCVRNSIATQNYQERIEK
jgi:hypothetical protein